MENTTKNVRRIVNESMKACNVSCYSTWTDKRFFGLPERKERYVSFAVTCPTGDKENQFLDCVKKYLRMNGIVDAKPRMVSGYLRMNSFIG